MLNDGPGENLGIAILGAGPAGLTAAHALARTGHAGTVVEADGTVGGIAKTVEFDGYRFDLGGHRFYTKLDARERLWQEALGDELLTRPRLSRIYYRGRFFNYPLQADDVFRRLGLIESARCALSCLRARLMRRKRSRTPSRSGWSSASDAASTRLLRVLHGEGLGHPGLRDPGRVGRAADPGVQPAEGVLGILGLNRRAPPTLIEEFHYPRLGPGTDLGGASRPARGGRHRGSAERRCVGISHDAGRVESIVIRAEARSGVEPVDSVLSTLRSPT